MAKTTRQTAIFGIEDWRRLYQTYREADFQSYDFETLRKSFIDYIRLYYPENFNDYIESSEFIALLDVMAFMGQALSYRVDLNTRENFLDTAERRDSVVRLAQLVGYTPKRNQAATGFLKVLAVSTTESVIDYNGINLSQAVINWNDPTNPDWQEQIIAIVNAALIDSQRFGRSGGTSTILGVRTDEYGVNLVPGFLPVIPFSSLINNTSMSFEVVSASTQGENYVYEPSPRPDAPFNILYRNDGLGFGSPDTGFFLFFKQGVLQNQDFVLSERVSNRVVNLGLDGVNNEDVWVYQLDNNGNIQDEWKSVENIYDTATYNQLTVQERKIYSITSRVNDAINLNFGDGIFSDIPVGLFRTYMRISNGLTYVIDPDDIQSVQIPITYVSRGGRNETLTLTVGLTNPVSNALARESIDAIKQRAPARYYTQNRMVNGEDYNNFPFTLFGSIIKSKAVNRTSLGISRYLDLTDPTGKYSSTNVFASDGMLYRESNLYSFTFVYDDVNDITDVIINSVEPRLSSRSMLQFYYDKNNFPRPVLGTSSQPLFWNYSTSLTNETTGYFFTQINDASEWDINSSYPAETFVQVLSGENRGFYQARISIPPGIEITNTGYWNNLNTSTGQKYQPVGLYANNNQRYITIGALIKFQAPEGQYFNTNNQLVNGTPGLPDEKTVIWASATSVFLDGTNFNQGNLENGAGPVTINNFVPTGAIATSVVPIFLTDLPNDLEQSMIEQIQLNRDFGLGYDYLNSSWYIISSANLSGSNTFSLTYARDQAGSNLDASWLVKFITDGEIYTVTFRNLDYFFASVLETRFFYDGSRKIYDTRTGSVIDDFINILKTNNRPQSSASLGSDIRTDIIGQPIESDGFVNDFVVRVSFTDSDNDGIADDPDFFDSVVGPENDPEYSHLVFFQRTVDFDNLERYLPVASGAINAIYPTLDRIELVRGQFNNGQVFFAYDQIGGAAFYTLRVDNNNNRTLVKDTADEYRYRTGRGNLMFQYRHNSPNTRRIDPSFSNIIDLYVVTNSYYVAYQNYIKDITGTVSEPSRPTIDALTTEYSRLQDYKMISDNVVLNSVRFKPLFGSKAAPELQATIKVVPQTATVISSSEIKSRILTEINNYFSIDKWDFGQIFYFSELSSYLHRQLGDIVSSVVLVPRDSGKSFGDLYEIHSDPDEIFVNAANINDIEVITALNSTTLRTLTSNT